jgi:hypothetical protein
MRAAVILAMLPLAVFSCAQVVPARNDKPIVAVPVTTENIRKVNIDTSAFAARWAPARDFPMPTVIHYVHDDAPVQQAEETSVVTTPRPRPISRVVTPHKPVADICQRHKRRKVWVTSTQWRCKR